MRKHLGHCLDVAAEEDEARRRRDAKAAVVVEFILSEWVCAVEVVCRGVIIRVRGVGVMFTNAELEISRLRLSHLSFPCECESTRVNTTNQSVAILIGHSEKFTLSSVSFLNLLQHNFSCQPFSPNYDH